MLFATAIAFGASGTALAQSAPPAPAPAVNWTGLYVGGMIGYGWMQNNNVTVTPGLDLDPTVKVPMSA